eukprot:TRINITY_DN6511_c0_g1_i1.p2 TRINITY_DN6511_c0_g1~~TRINITY_DN6511_c0_g1_i1.p2  ORF type:complete len:127 (+),score=15.16 TRINITY_DN6511_c0_g1_i1:1-381(+)
MEVKTEWFESIKSGNIESIKKLLQKYPEVANSTTFPKFTALQLASKSGNYEVCRILVENGARVNDQDHHGRTSLHWAVESENKNLCKLLVEHGGDLYTKNEYGRSVIDWAPNEEIRSFLVSLSNST